MKPTAEQAAIEDAGADLKPGEILKVLAFAGAGKTSTLKMVAKRKPERGVYLVFNAQNAEEARKKLALTNCSASTTHSLAFGAMREYIGSPANHSPSTVRESGVMDRFSIPKVAGWNQYRLAMAVLRAVRAFASSADEEFGHHHGVEAIISAVGDPDRIRNREVREAAREAVERLSGVTYQAAEAFWLEMTSQGSFSHDMYLKYIDLDANLRGQAFSMFRYLMVDEAQDLNPVQRSIIVKTGLPVIAVGDPYQQIYSWRGAENALGLMEGKELYLTQSFRFGEDLAEIARGILASRPDGGPEQRLTGAGNGDITGHVGAKLAFVCRTNAGVIDQALSLVRKGKTPYVDNMDGLVRDVRSAQALFDGRLRDVRSPDLVQFTSWDEMQMEAEEGDANLARLVGIVEDNIVPQIEELASNRVKDPAKAQVAVCTAHRSKGMEWPAVVLGDDWKDIGAMRGRHRGAKKKSEKDVTLALEEWNALYVGATRAMVRLRGHERILNPPKPEFDRDAGPDGGQLEEGGNWVPEDRLIEQEMREKRRRAQEAREAAAAGAEMEKQSSRNWSKEDDISKFL